MFPHPMSRSEFQADDSSPDPTQTLEQHLFAGFPPDLALDLVLNELVARAAAATHATAAALALARGDEMVCRAATGDLAPDLGVPLNTRDGLSGACLQTRQPQLSVDTEFDPRVDPAIARRLGIRSILIVPIFDISNKTKVTGVLEVSSTSLATFSHSDQKLLEGFAEECARIHQAALEFGQRQPAAASLPLETVSSGLDPHALDRPNFDSPHQVASNLDAPDFDSPTFGSESFVSPHFGPANFNAAPRPRANRSPYEAWTLFLGGLVILATIAVSFLIGSRLGWPRHALSHAQ